MVSRIGNPNDQTGSADPPAQPSAKRGGRMHPDRAVVEEVPVWLEVNGEPTITWMCTPDQLEELAVGWLHGEGYLHRLQDLKQLKPCASELGFWAEVEPARVAAVKQEHRRRVLASGCGAVTTLLADPASLARRAGADRWPEPGQLRALFKEMFARGERYRDSGGIHAAALTDGATLLHHAEDIGRHNAVDKVIGAALLAGRPLAGLGLLVTGRISAELAFKAARAEMAYVATPSVPSSLAVRIAGRAGMLLIGRAVSGAPHLHAPPAA